MSRTFLPVTFANKAEAKIFIRSYLDHFYKRGRSGYSIAGDGWWGCLDDLACEMHRYTVEDDPNKCLSHRLTPREREVVLLVSEGLSNKEVGRRLRLAEGTVKIHLHNIYDKVGVQNRTALTAMAIAYRDQGAPALAPSSFMALRNINQ